MSNNVSTTADKVYIQYKSRYFGDDLKHDNICNILSATSTNAGVMSATDKRKLDSLSNYTLPTADSSTLGGIKIGSGLNIDSNGTVSVNNKLYILVNSLESVTTPDTNKIYLVQSTETVPDGELNVYVEWIYVNNKWEKLGEFKTAVDLTPYAKTADVTSAINAAKTELTGNIATAKSEAISEAKSEAATAAEQLYRSKTSWAGGGTITSETYYNILKGTQDSFTLPFDLNGFVSGITANGNAQRYSGVIIAVSYANTSEQPKQRSDTLYLPFAAVNAEKGVVAFEDLQFHYTDLAGTDVDVRYKVTPVSGSQIKLEKVKESAGAAELPWLDVTPQSEEEFGKFVAAFIHEAGLHGKADYELNLNASTDLTQYRGIRIDLGEGNVVETPVVATVGNGFICAPAFLSDNEFVFGITKETGGKFILHIYNLSSQYANSLSDYAKKTDIPQQPFTFVVNGDNLKIDSRKLDIFVLNDCYVGAEFSIVLPTDIQSKLNGIIGELNAVLSETASSDFSVRTSDITSRMPKFFLRVSSGSAMICFQSAQSHDCEYTYRLSFYAAVCDTDVYYSTRWIASYTSSNGCLTFKCIKKEQCQDYS